jgi:D-beta-D-heptose 7-phosphate kinase/D-beta-D-heptose 1-phosphate adenosyltransferase
MDFSAITVLCVGDVMLDRFLYGRMERISPEAPVPVLLLDARREMPGGAGNVASNILSLGGRAVLVGLTGQDEAGATLRGALAERAGLQDATCISAVRPTICKTRFIAAHQQVVRVDEESRSGLEAREAESLCAAITAHMGQVQAVVVSDYGKGVCAPVVLEHLFAQAEYLGGAGFCGPQKHRLQPVPGGLHVLPPTRVNWRRLRPCRWRAKPRWKRRPARLWNGPRRRPFWPPVPKKA